MRKLNIIRILLKMELGQFFNLFAVYDEHRENMEEHKYIINLQAFFNVVEIYLEFLTKFYFSLK